MQLIRVSVVAGRQAFRNLRLDPHRRSRPLPLRRAHRGHVLSRCNGGALVCPRIIKPALALQAMEQLNQQRAAPAISPHIESAEPPSPPRPTRRPIIPNADRRPRRGAAILPPCSRTARRFHSADHHGRQHSRQLSQRRRPQRNAQSACRRHRRRGRLSTSDQLQWTIARSLPAFPPAATSCGSPAAARALSPSARRSTWRRRISRSILRSNRPLRRGQVVFKAAKPKGAFTCA